MVKGTNDNESRRVFSFDDNKEFFIITPTADDIRASDWYYSKVYSSALREGVPTQAEMQDILKDRGISGEEYDKKIEDMKDEIGGKIVEMELSSDKKIKKTLAVEITKLREELFAWNQRVGSPMSHTCEQMSEDARIEHLTSAIVQNKDGSRVWEDFDSYKTENSRELAWRARFEVMLFLQGLEPDFIEKTPENIVLKELEKAEVDSKKVKETSKKKPARKKPSKKKTVKKAVKVDK
jgi:hypothetical protein